MLKKITHFIHEHHVLTLATSHANRPHACSLFYAYDVDTQSFIVASSDETQHIQDIIHNPLIAGNILLETNEVGKIQGLQFKGVIEESLKENQNRLYFKRFPYAKVLSPKLWIIEVESFKMTDNRLGFGKKLFWNRDES
ncbi:MAG: pyridoxamine 5'-phosphate oxidase family protein [Campylobacterales bacterium]|nr:pyridoxamine 5'-phosphate oxidase family protein [Campylobacterales bacterium]